VKKDIDCQVFEDQLEALVGRHLSEEGLRSLYLHAASCPECAMLLKVHEHLASPSLEELEASVPEEVMTSIWTRVEESLAIQREGESPESGGPGRTGVASGTVPQPRTGWKWGWIVPTLAAASAVLLLSTGLLFQELRSARSQVRRMADQAQILAQLAAEWSDGANVVERTARLAEGGRSHGRALDLAFLGQEDIRLASLLELLRNLPPDRVLFHSSRLETLRRIPARPSPELKQALDVLDRAVREMGSSEEVRAGDLAEWLATSDLPADLALPKSPIIEILS